MCKITRRAALLAVRQPGGVAEHRAGHAELARRPGHRHREPVLAAAQGFGQHRRRVVGRAGDQAQDRVLDPNGVAGPQAELGRRHPRGTAGDLDARGQIQLAGGHRPEGQVQRHHLGQRRRNDRFVGVARRKHVPATIVDQDGRLLTCGGGVDEAAASNSMPKKDDRSRSPQRIVPIPCRPRPPADAGQPGQVPSGVG